MTSSQELARFVVRLDGATLGGEIVALAKGLVLDHLGCAARGSRSPTAAACARMLAAIAAAQEPATAVVGGLPVRAEWAIFANGVAAHSIELDDTHSASSSHPGVVVLPAALAAAELAGSSGADLLAAVVAGYEVAGRVGRALDPAAVYARGFHPTAIVGPLAAAATVGKLLGLCESELAHALGIAASTSAGRLEFLHDGSWTKRFHPGHAGHSGYLAARLAEAGFTGPVTAFEGRDGMLRGYGAADREHLLVEGLGDPFELEQTSIKPHACCRYSQGPIDLAIALAREHDLRPEAIERVRVAIASPGLILVADPPEHKRVPRSEVEAQFSLPFALGLAIARRRAGLEEHGAEARADAAVLAVAARVEVRSTPELDARFPACWPAELEIELHDGRTLRARLDHPRGDPENRLSPAELSAKFRELASVAYSEDALDEIEAAVGELDAEEGPARLVGALRTAR